MVVLIYIQWHAYNLIRPADLLTASAIRRVTTETASTGATSSQRVHTNLTIRVKSLDFDPQAAQVHVSGQIAIENKYTKIGQHHTLDLELSHNFTLEKVIEGKNGGEGWDSVARAQLEEAIDQSRGTEIIAVVLQEGIANICFITQYQTILRQRIDMTIPRKGGDARGAQGHDKGLQKFFKVVLDTLLRQLEGLMEGKDSGITFPILLASPGFVADSFLRYINERAWVSTEKVLQRLLKQKVFVKIHTSSGHLHSLNEVLKSQEVLAKLKNTKYARETALMDRFFTMLRKDDARAWYGPKEVEAAAEQGAVGRGGGVLLISHALFRSDDIATRRRWVKLVDSVREDWGGEVRILSSDHESGRRLEAMSGVAAILTYPIEDLDDDDDSDENT